MSSWIKTMLWNLLLMLHHIWQARVEKELNSAKNSFWNSISKQSSSWIERTVTQRNSPSDIYLMLSWLCREFAGLSKINKNKNKNRKLESEKQTKTAKVKTKQINNKNDFLAKRKKLNKNVRPFYCLIIIIINALIYCSSHLTTSPAAKALRKNDFHLPSRGLSLDPVQNEFGFHIGLRSRFRKLERNKCDQS